MKRKQASLVINPRSGQNVAKITDVLAVLTAAGWKTELALKEYGGHTMELATQAAEEGQDYVIAYGGDGTLNQVVNGVMHTKQRESVVGLIPGGTANVWANEVGLPADPVQAALTLINSEPRKVDIGYVCVDDLVSEEEGVSDGLGTGKKVRNKQKKASGDVRQHFLLMAGLGIDANIMEHVSRPLKHQVGALAVGISALKSLPDQHPFPVEIHIGNDSQADIHWKGEALQVVIGNTRLYADVVKMTPDAYIDDGVLDVCVITSGNPIRTMQQVASLLLRQQPDNVTAEYFRGKDFTITVPASAGLQLDGSAVKLKDYVSKADKQLLKTVDHDQQMVTYHFTTLPHALKVAIPRTYQGELFETSHHQEGASAEQAASDQEKDEKSSSDSNEAAKPLKARDAVELEHIQALMEHGQKVTVVGVTSQPGKKERWIIAGTVTKQTTGENRPVAVTIDQDTAIHTTTGEDVDPHTLSTLKNGAVLMVDGKKSKRGVIPARTIILGE